MEQSGTTQKAHDYNYIANTLDASLKNADVDTKGLTNEL